MKTKTKKKKLKSVSFNKNPPLRYKSTHSQKNTQTQLLTHKNNNNASMHQANNPKQARPWRFYHLKFLSPVG